MAEPPTYTSTSASTPSTNGEPQSSVWDNILLNIAPLPSSVSFQTGHLGHTESALEGEVQVKIIDQKLPLDDPPLQSTGSSSHARSSSGSQISISKIEILFRGVEQSPGNEIELIEQRRTLWDQQMPLPSSSSQSTSSFPPASIPFKFELTADLPHCIHLMASSLEYRLTATIFFSNANVPPLQRTSPVHLTRYSPPGPLLPEPDLRPSTSTSSTSTETVAVSDPVPMTVTLSATRFRRSEQLLIEARIPPPNPEVLRARGLRLRNVSAEIIRTIRSTPGGDDTSSANSSSVDLHDPTATLTTTHPAPREAISVLARSGKSCRFSQHRPVLIRLGLQPLANSSPLCCESITQSTILHDISFFVRVSIGVSSAYTNGPPTSDPNVATASNSSPEHRQDVGPTIERRLELLPDVPVNPRNEKQREDLAHSTSFWEETGGPVPAYHDENWVSTPPAESSSTSVLPSPTLTVTGGSSSRWMNQPQQDMQIEEEFDGYEEVSALAGLRSPPPTIDEDESPPPAEDPPPGMELGSSDSDSSPRQGPFGSTDFSSSRESFMLIPLNPTSISMALQDAANDDVDPRSGEQSFYDDHAFHQHAVPRHSPSPPPGPYADVQDSYSSSESDDMPSPLLHDGRPPPYAGMPPNDHGAYATPLPPPSYQENPDNLTMSQESQPMVGVITSNGDVGVIFQS